MRTWFLLAALAACAPTTAEFSDVKDDDPLDETPPVIETPDDVDKDPPVDSDPPVVGDSDDEPDPDPVIPPGSLTPADCFGPQWAGTSPVDYSWQGAVMGSHCQGTNHQDIQDVERVVFLGDSITVGTPPTLTHEYYRNLLADDFVNRWGLEAPDVRWRNVNFFEGMSASIMSGDFASCAKYGARTDDILMDPHRQLETCIPEDERDKRTLIVMTFGGNDIFSLLEDIMTGVPEADNRAAFARATRLLRESLEWIKTPGRFPNGVYVIFGNIYDFTDPDGASDMASCPGAQLIGMDRPLNNPVFQDIIKDAQEDMLSMAVDTQTDLFFLGETFCGHGYANTDSNNRCYRGAGSELWLDFTCEHPNAAGHRGIYGMVTSVIDE